MPLDKELHIIYETGQDFEDIKHALQIIAAVKARCEKRMNPKFKTIGKIVFKAVGSENKTYTHSGDWLLKMNGDKIAYGFRVKERSDNNMTFEINEILRKTDELCGNRTGNNFITTQINYNGQRD